MRQVALEHEVCPYYLSQELARWSDVIVGDYNYYFDSSAMLYALAESNQWRVSVLVDEAHNLVERARRMYSASLEQSAFKAAGEQNGARRFKKTVCSGCSGNGMRSIEYETNAYQVYPDVPASVLSAAQNLIGAVTDHLADAPLSIDDTLLRTFFDAIHFVSLAEQFGEHSVFDIRLGGPRAIGRGHPTSILCVRNVVPAHFLAPRHSSAQASILFSGTLTPEPFYRDMLGLPNGTSSIDVEGPFQPEQLKIHIATHVSTRWRDREESLRPIVDLMARQYAELPGNYLGFLSSFDYLQRIAALMETHPHVPIWTQSPGMDEAARDEFLARFRTAGRGIGFGRARRRILRRCRFGRRAIDRRVRRHAWLAQVNEVNEEMKLHDGRKVRQRLRLCLPVSGPAESRAGRRPSDPRRNGRRGIALDRRSVPACGSQTPAAEVVGAA